MHASKRPGLQFKSGTGIYTHELSEIESILGAYGHVGICGRGEPFARNELDPWRSRNSEQRSSNNATTAASGVGHVTTTLFLLDWAVIGTGR
jgi:hypothetical protein